MPLELEMTEDGVAGGGGIMAVMSEAEDGEPVISEATGVIDPDVAEGLSAPPLLLTRELLRLKHPTLQKSEIVDQL